VLIFVFAFLGFAVLFEYAGPPLKYRYHYLGEIGPFLAGVLVLEGAYYIDTGMINIDVLLVSIPFSIIKALLAFLGNSRDIETDRKVGIKTISMFFGMKKSVKIYIALFSFSYLFFLFLIIFNLLPIYSLIIYLTLPLFILHAKNFSTEGIPPDAEKFAGAISTYILLLSVISLILNYIHPA